MPNFHNISTVLMDQSSDLTTTTTPKSTWYISYIKNVFSSHHPSTHLHPPPSSTHHQASNIDHACKQRPSTTASRLLLPPSHLCRNNLRQPLHADENMHPLPSLVPDLPPHPDHRDPTAQLLLCQSYAPQAWQQEQFLR